MKPGYSRRRLAFFLASATARVRRMLAPLQASEGRYRIISEMISDYAFCNRVEPDGRVVCEWITESFERMTGYTPQELITLETQRRFALFHADDQTRLEQDMTRLLAAKLSTRTT